MPAIFSAAFNDVEERHIALCIEHTHTLWRMELVAGHGEHVNIHVFHIDRQMTRSLHGIGVEGDALFAAESADFLHGLDRADFIVGKHNGDKGGIFPNGGFQVFQADDAVFMHIEQGDLEPLLLQLFKRVENGMMLKRGGNEMPLPFSRSGFGRRNDGLIIGLAAA